MQPNRIKVEDDTGLPHVLQPGDGPIATGLDIKTLTTVGAGSVLAPSLAGGILHRTGPTGAFADTLPTGTEMDAAFPKAQIGEIVQCYYINGVAFASTITANTDMTLGAATANNVIAASTGRTLMFKRTAANTWVCYVV